jgi:hypothetical protein
LPEPFAAPQSAPETSNPRDRDTSKRAGTRDVRDLARDWIWPLSFCVVALLVGYGGLRAARRGTTNPDEIWKQAEADLQTGKFDSAESAAEQLSRLGS